MADVEVQSEEDLRVFRNPYPVLITGIISVAVAGLVDMFTGHGLPPLRFALLAIGVLAVGTGVAISPRSSLVLALAAATAILASFIGPKTEWDSARMALFWVFGLVGMLAAILMALPSLIRRIVVSFLIVFHFGGIATAIASADNSWLSMQLWVTVYRPYLQFFYLNNAYHFYAPEPGPAPLIWFCIEYEPDPDGTRNLRWVKVPSLDSDGIARRPDGTELWPNVEYTRRLSLAESTNHATDLHPLNLEKLLNLRMRAAEKYGIPMRPDMAPLAQFHEPAPDTKLYLSSYARYVASHFPHEQKPDRAVIGVKIYTAIHMLILPAQLNGGIEPNDPTMYSPSFMGDYDKDGNLKPGGEFIDWYDVANDRMVRLQRDPFLYWKIPIVRQSDSPQGPFHVHKQPKLKVINYVKIHAGDRDDGELP